MTEKNISKTTKIKTLITKKNAAFATLAFVAVSGATAFGVSRVSADTGSQTTLVQMIAQKFGLNQSDVQSVVDQYRQNRQSQMEAQFKTRLDQDVTAGKITAAQETLIINERQTLAANRQSQMANFKNMTQAQRQAAMQQNKQDVTTWAKQNNIDIQYLYGGFGRMGMGRGFGSGNGNQATN